MFGKTLGRFSCLTDFETTHCCFSFSSHISRPLHIHPLVCFLLGDINECLLGSHHCRAGEVCINIPGLYRCQREISCGTGYELTDSNSCKGYLTNLKIKSETKSCVKIVLKDWFKMLIIAFFSCRRKNDQTWTLNYIYLFSLSFWFRYWWMWDRYS